MGVVLSKQSVTDGVVGVVTELDVVADLLLLLLRIVIATGRLTPTLLLPPAPPLPPTTCGLDLILAFLLGMDDMDGGGEGI